ncbi:MAG: hypothetical protein QM674_16770 [Burkholderiaceae bacterium]
MSAMLPAPGAHFLDRVVASAHGLAPSIEPHLPSLFEPVAARGDALAAFGVSGRAGTDRQGVNADLDSGPYPDAYPGPHAGRFAALLVRAGAGRDGATAASGSSTGGQPRPSAVADTSASSGMRRVGASRMAAIEPDGQPSANPWAARRAALEPIPNETAVAVVTDPALVAASVRRGAAGPAAAIGRTALPPPARRRDDAGDPDREDRDFPGAQARGRAPSDAALIARRVPFALPLTDSPQRTTGRDAHDARRPAPPDVHISIGRVEIRAQVSKPASPPAPARTSAPTRLEQYLARKEPRR